ncbi:MAG: tRNA uridine-5-carboxymethylaminomethyl(34) synthesis GTPase MnmE [Gemmatimonadetes bacterium]|nr:tRNA uridine-5-carboxymethylaminomethyl(34) synthesis GTPase MnmE [Gemmatimonadota bacterium]NNM05771.1 tRNA uridine-5-carboxymethylaminomethyl(34) synthesis GTPase MnmE [Gemmatimonadota bacterium]
MADPDTIVAVGTPPGPSALAVVRLSGPDAIPIVTRLCPGLPRSPEPRKVHLTRALNPVSREGLDRVLVTVFPGPESYTGEDMAEISSHGGWLSPNLILEGCLGAGARLAGEGEFTRRAYLNGKMDLLQVEAVLDLIESRSRALHETAIHQLERGLSERIGSLREGIVDLEAHLVHHLDFPEEDDPPIPLEAILGKAAELVETMELLLRTAPEGELLRDGALTVLAGRPNSGKSSLFNALIGEERAIVTEIPGTTRDALEVTVSLGGYPFRLVDTAGLRETEERVEKMGVEVARRYLNGADVILFCVEGARALNEEEEGFLAGVGDTPVVLARTKADLLRRVGERPSASDGEVVLSVQTGEGLNDLRRVLRNLVFSGLVNLGGEVPVLTRKRHREGIGRAREELEGFRTGLAQGLPAEVVATHLRPAETALEELLGVIPREEILNRLFREFCIGK